MLRKIVTGALVCVAISLSGAGSASAAGKGATVDTYPVEWTVISENCNQLPEGLNVSGSGTFKDTFLPSGGVESQGRGTATDSAGNTYVWHYASHSTAETGGFIDHFNLSGSGPAAYVTAFQAVATATTFEPVWVHGDPFDFVNGTGRCDPL